jgi:putative Holliday junction resolvase
MHDERLTTIEAKTIIFNNSGTKKHNEKKIHALSAVIILESWLNKDQIHI